MRILSWNVNGIRAVYKNSFIPWLTNSGADILCIQEAKAELNQIPWDLQFIPEYELYLNSSVTKKGYSGTAVYSKEKPKQVLTEIGIDRFDREGRIQISKFEKFELINVYVPNGAPDQRDMGYKLDFYNTFIKMLSMKSHEKVILAGDFNIAHTELDLSRPQQNKNSTMFTPKEREQIQNIINEGFYDTFRLFNKEGGNYSWLSYYKNYRDNNIGWRIDYIFVSTSLKDKVKDAYILEDVSGSDHVPVGIDIDL